MRWTAANIFHNVNHFLGGFHREEGASITDRTEEIRLAMLDCLGESGCVAFPMTERKVRFAKDVQDLWYLRADVMAAMSAMQGERVARQKVEEFSPKFRGLLPRSLDTRSSGF
ncbi:MAG TPA: hypothetical protein PK497_07570 [Burkholderiaceae bacterium]|jgi:hypothetical protein|nr:hypothetical protein [Burkholderiaceae bacterium]HPH14172.1 hypothetical protein [Burkholderiaceae bacterium]